MPWSSCCDREYQPCSHIAVTKLSPDPPWRCCRPRLSRILGVRPCAVATLLGRDFERRCGALVRVLVTGGQSPAVCPLVGSLEAEVGSAGRAWMPEGSFGLDIRRTVDRHMRAGDEVWSAK